MLVAALGESTGTSDPSEPHRSRGFGTEQFGAPRASRICDARISHKHQDAELTIAALCGLIQHFLGPAWHPFETHFEHERAGLRRDYRRAFGETVFDQSTNAILIDCAFLDLPMPQQNLRVFVEVRALIRHQLASADVKPTSRVCSAATERLAPDPQ